MPTMLRAIIEDLLASEPGLVVVGRTIAGEDPLIRAREEQADMLITSDASLNGDSCLQAILSGPPLSILAIARDGRDATAVTLARRPVDFATEGKPAFADAVRRVAGAH
jgi:hypothetical protein